MFIKTKQHFVKGSQKYLLWNNIAATHAPYKFRKYTPSPIQHQNNQTLAVESFNINSGMYSEIVSDIFLPGTGNHYNLSQQNDFFLPSIQTIIIIVKAYLT